MCDLRPEMLDVLGRRFPAVRQTRDFDEMLDDPTAWMRSRSSPRSPPTTTWRCERSKRGQARVRREATRAVVGRGDRPDPSGGRARPRADAGPYVPVQPAGQPHSRPHPLRGARRDLLHLDVPGQSRPAPVRRERHLGSRAARLLDPPVLAGRSDRARSSAWAAPASTAGKRTWRSSTASSTPARSLTSSCPGWRPASCAGRQSWGRTKMVVYDDCSNEPVRVYDSGVMPRNPESFGEYLKYRTGDIVSPHIPSQRADRASDGGLLPRNPLRLDAPLHRRSSGSTSCSMIEAARALASVVTTTRRLPQQVSASRCPRSTSDGRTGLTNADRDRALTVFACWC